MGRLVPLFLILLGLGAGIGAGIALKPAHKAGIDASTKEGAGATTAENKSDPASKNGKGKAIPDPGATEAPKDETEIKERTYVSIGTQTIIPVVEGERTRALMLFELAVDVYPSAHDQAVMLEPRLRDAFLRELLKMSSTGAFTKTYTEDWVIDELRKNLGKAARRFLGDGMREILVLDVIRQEL